MAKHHPDLIMLRKQPDIAIGRLCEKCDGKCIICDSITSTLPDQTKGITVGEMFNEVENLRTGVTLSRINEKKGRVGSPCNDEMHTAQEQSEDSNVEAINADDPLRQRILLPSAIVRNSKGEVILAATWRCSFSDNVEFSEALTIFEGLKMARVVGLHSLVIESDSKNVVDLILGKIKSYREVGWLVYEIQDMAVAGNCLFKSVPRVYNAATHMLAKMALLSSDNNVWLEEAPPELIPFLYVDSCGVD
ncbi:PHD finger-like domain-containing protein 5B [Melia azedarach]|uniref:PHD finger-like domain-containing protein 5B n=1 Tax=Melia azedarach TaxID=155640 RepID=A0ACC1YI71_MELAZ|nr:PHD finger-like domain-containing protein 5B [Melia azedarach]